MTYAACLRTCEPVAAFHEPERAVRDPARAETGLEEVGRWLEKFHLPGRSGEYFPGTISGTGMMRL